MFQDVGDFLQAYLIYCCLSWVGPQSGRIEGAIALTPRLLGCSADAGYQAKTYAGARAFLNSVRAEDKGCVVTDVRMPGLGGGRRPSVVADLASRVYKHSLSTPASRSGRVESSERPPARAERTTSQMSAEGLEKVFVSKCFG
jgi:hypothetical protein